MSGISHHVSSDLLLAYAVGQLPHAFSVAVASHISICDRCRVEYEALQVVGGSVMDRAAPAEISVSMRANIMAMLDDAHVPERAPKAAGAFPAPVVAALGGRDPRWKKLGMGVRQDILYEDKEGSVRLLSIPPGQAVPDHGHRGLELTLVLQGSFSDETGSFGVGDIEMADSSLEHTPIADDGETCICLAATDAPLRFRAFVPRLLQPLFRI